MTTIPASSYGRSENHESPCSSSKNNIFGFEPSSIGISLPPDINYFSSGTHAPKSNNLQEPSQLEKCDIKTTLLLPKVSYPPPKKMIFNWSKPQDMIQSESLPQNEMDGPHRSSVIRGPYSDNQL